MEIPIDEIEALRAREIGYDLRPIACLPWNNFDGDATIAYGLGCSGRLWQGHRLSNAELQPHPVYYQLCRDGAETLGAAFLDYFLDSSFLADGETAIRDWEADR